jgi:drug/metabolite transporter (DMT)-like permease
LSAVIRIAKRGQAATSREESPRPNDPPLASSGLRRAGAVGLPQDLGWQATAYGIASAVGYTLANICLRALTELDPVWVSQLKALPTVIGMIPFVAMRMVQGQAVLPSFRVLGIIILGAMIGQLLGNVAFQWSLGVVGIALSVPLTLGAMIVSGALFGSVLLGDRVSRSVAVASVVLMLSIVILSLGAPQANASIERVAAGMGGADRWRVLLGVAAACVSGFAYSGLGVALRLATHRGTPICSLLLIVAATGFVLLGAIVQWRFGHLPWYTLQGPALFYMVAAGTFNLLAFAALTKALHLSSVVFVNALNASQTAMAAVIGVLMFGEASSWPMVLGVLLTVFGLLMMKGRRRPPLSKTADESPVREAASHDP